VSRLRSLEPIKSALKEADLSGELFSCIQAIEMRTRRVKLDVLVGELHNDGEISLFSRENVSALEALGQNEFWDIFRLLYRIIPRLESPFQDVVTFVRIIFEKAGADLMVHRLHQSFTDWCRAHPQEAQKLVTSATESDPDYLRFSPHAIRGLDDSSLAFKLVSSDNEEVVSVGFGALGSLLSDDEEFAKKVIDLCCDEILNRKLLGPRNSAIDTAFKSWDLKGGAINYRQVELIEAVLGDEYQIDEVVFAQLLLYYGNGLAQESLDLVMEALRRDVSEPLTLLKLLDSALASRDSRWKFTQTVEVFETQLPRIKDEVVVEDFHHFYKWVFEIKANTSELYSRWLVSGDSKLCVFLEKLLGQNGRKGKEISILREHLPKNENEQIFLIRKCVGFFWFQEISAASILLSCIKNGKSGAKEAAELLLYDPLLLSYGGRLHDYLKEQLDSSSKRISECANRLLIKHSKYLSELSGIDKISELLPSSEQRHLAGLKQLKFNRDVHKKSHEHSVLAQLATRQTILYGTKSLYMIRGSDNEVSPSIQSMSEYSYSTEIPRLSIVDPVGFNLMLSIFRAERKL